MIKSPIMLEYKMSDNSPVKLAIVCLNSKQIATKCIFAFAFLVRVYIKI